MYKSPCGGGAFPTGRASIGQNGSSPERNIQTLELSVEEFHEGKPALQGGRSILPREVLSIEKQRRKNRWSSRERADWFWKGGDRLTKKL